jgi:hypothetical protein
MYRNSQIFQAVLNRKSPRNVNARSCGCYSSSCNRDYSNCDYSNCGSDKHSSQFPIITYSASAFFFFQPFFFCFQFSRLCLLVFLFCAFAKMVRVACVGLVGFGSILHGLLLCSVFFFFFFFSFTFFVGLDFVMMKFG